MNSRFGSNRKTMVWFQPNQKENLNELELLSNHNVWLALPVKNRGKLNQLKPVEEQWTPSEIVKVEVSKLP